jgi:hypothetical protein
VAESNLFFFAEFHGEVTERHGDLCLPADDLHLSPTSGDAGSSNKKSMLGW